MTASPDERFPSLVQSLSGGAGVATGRMFGHGRLMKEWIAMCPDAAVDWVTLAAEAMEYVHSGR